MKRIETTLSEIEYILWQKFCHSTNKTSTQNLRQFIQNSISQIQNNSDITAPSPPIKPLKNNKITIRFTQSQCDAILTKVALEGYKNPTDWLRCLVMNVLYQEAVLTDKEIHALERVSHQLWAIGHNLNQVTRALNANFNATDTLKLEMVQSIKNLNTETRDAFSALIRQNKNRWQKRDAHKSKIS